MTNADLITALQQRPSNEEVQLLDETQFNITGGIEGKHIDFTVEEGAGEESTSVTVLKFNPIPE